LLRRCAPRNDADFAVIASGAKQSRWADREFRWIQESV
jgi:hypothetical protein